MSSYDLCISKSYLLFNVSSILFPSQTFPNPGIELCSLSSDFLTHFTCVSVLSLQFCVVLYMNLDNTWSYVCTPTCLCF